MWERGEPIRCEESAQNIVARRKSTIRTGLPDAPGSTAPVATEQTESPKMVSSSPDERKKGKMWDTEEIMVYYEAVKQHGKDWDRLVASMQKKKIHKDKDQIRNFFFNCVKFLKNLTGINPDEVFPMVCRDAKELFFVINSCEWRKRTGAAKYQPERMKELILDGITTIKANKKNVVIKTPFCPALQKYFTEFRIAQNDKPSEIVVTLLPATYRDKSYVLSCEQNPVLSLKIATNDRIGRIFEVLAQKWKRKLSKTDTAVKISLLPDKTTEVGRVSLVGADPNGDTVSLKRLKTERDSIEQRKTNENDPATPKTIVPTYNAVINQPFTIDDQTVINGLTEANVGEASVAELYCLCGVTPNIRLVYKIDYPQEQCETWRLFRELLLREFGEQLSSSGREEERPKEPTSKAVTVEAEPAGQTIPLNTRRVKRAALTPVAHPPASPIGSIKEQEDIQKFKQQLKDFSNKTPKSRGKRKENGSMAPFPEQRRPTEVLYSTTDYSTGKRYYATEPTDFSQMVAASSSGSSTQHSLSSKGVKVRRVDNDNRQSSFPKEQSTLSYHEIFDGNLDFSPRKVAANSLCSDSMQKIVASAMTEAMKMDSNQAINVFSELLDDFESTS